jgi:hypothetical protein
MLVIALALAYAAMRTDPMQVNNGTLPLPRWPVQKKQLHTTPTLTSSAVVMSLRF